MNNTAHQPHCFTAWNVLDWISKQTIIHLSKTLACDELVTDKICGNIRLQGDKKTLLWHVKGPLSVSGNVTVYHRWGHQPIVVIINQRKEHTILKGETLTLSITNLKTLEVRGDGTSNAFSIGKYSLTIQYRLSHGYANPATGELICYLSDKDGNPVKSLRCMELIQTPNRKTVKVSVSHNTTTYLQKVQVLLKGFITIRVVENDREFKIDTIPFQVEEDFLLYAPVGSFIKCQISDVQCSVYYTNKGEKINVMLEFCQQLQMVENKVIEMLACPTLPDTG
ncbi:hypothetical protein GGQ92_002524 [Gracilibacillus halotolerans]|uniref:Endospore appendages core domain-containing protein n=1 Tax=Gracilibacillus halotolerans TaxID=74386 RepID=A0A841RHQ0_9BACI|nr:S-Ena type endospore appendage [Gracilibacillus halotolerans]MBB6513710.1 hypothetical protein [Gracilibacillus halotolerans]